MNAAIVFYEIGNSQAQVIRIEGQNKKTGASEAPV